MESASARPAIDMQSHGDQHYRMQADARETPGTRFTGRLWKVNAGTRASIYDEVITVKGKNKILVAKCVRLANRVFSA